MRRTLMTSLLAAGGLIFAAMQMGRMRNRRSFWRNALFSVTNSMNDMVRSSNHMLRSFRKRARF